MDKPANRFYGEQRAEIKPDVYGEVILRNFNKAGADILIDNYLTAHELREAAHLYNQLAEVLERE